MTSNLSRLAATLLAASVSLTACAASPALIKPAHVSSDRYAAFDCDQVRNELIRVSDRSRKLSGGQRFQAVTDPVVFGVGVAVFWPALFLLGAPDHEDEISQLKGEYETLESTAIEKKCPIADELAAARAPAALARR